MKIGLLGGSFDPPHHGHVLISERLRVLLGLDFIWWLVSPQNPLKKDPSLSTAQRLAACQAIRAKTQTKAKIYVSAEEERLGTQYTADTLKVMTVKYPQINFVWLMGADNLKNLHRWNCWQDIMMTMPMAVYPRPGETVRGGLGLAATCFAQNRLPAHQAGALMNYKAPAWVLVEGVTSDFSSTQIRKTKTQKRM